MLTFAAPSATPASAPNRSRLVRGVMSVLLAIALVVTGFVVTTKSAEAAGPGTGYGNWNDTTFGFHGSFTTGNGSYIYCIEPSIPLPRGATTDQGYWGNVNGITGDRLAGINAIITKYGQVPNNSDANRRQAVAVGVAVKAVADYNATVYSFGYDGRYGADISGFIQWIMYRHVGGGAELADIQNKANAYYSEAMNTRAGSSASGSGQFTWQVDPFNNYLGTVTVSVSPSNATGTVTLTNGVFTANGTNTMTGVRNGSVLGVRGVPPVNAGSYKIAATGNFTAPGGGYAGSVRVYTTPGEQTAVGPGTLAIQTFSFRGEDPIARSGQFIPELVTEATSYVQEGESFQDNVRFFAVADDEGTLNPWRQNGTQYAPVTARGVLYGPYASQPAVRDTVPAGAPVAATATVTTTTAKGPGTYTVSAGTARQSGFYTWVWEIHQAEQTPNVRAVIPAGYSFVDKFGLTAETSVVPMKPVATSLRSHNWADPGERVTDSLTVTNSNGMWLADTAATFEGTAYGVPNGAVPKVTSTVPAGAVPLAARSLTFTGPGTKTAEPVTVPDEYGSIVWVWRFVGASQAQPDMFAAGYTWQDDFGLVDETTRVRMSPELSTKVVSKYPAPDEAFEDTVTLDVSKGQYIDGAVIEAYGTLYGPIADEPVESAEVPEDAPVAQYAQLTFRGEETLTTNTGFIPEAAGHYTWVWRISTTEQSAKDQVFLPAGYLFQDAYGLGAETSVRSMELGGKSAVTQPTLVLGEETVDTLEVWVENGEWLQRDGENIPLTFRGTSYFVPGDERPVQSSEIPEGAELIQTVMVDITEPGVHTMPAAAGEESRKGFRTWVWELLEEDQPEHLRGMVENWADEFGMPDETQDVLVPTVRTMSLPGVGLGGEIFDTAIVEGPMPVRGAELTFEAYAIPMVQDEAGKWVIDFPEAAEPEVPGDGESSEEPGAGAEDELPADPSTEEPVDVNAWDWVVSPENLIGSNLDAGQIITEPGEYVSPKFTVNAYQKVLWVESLWTVDPALSEEGEQPVGSEEPVEGEAPVDGEEPVEVPMFERQLIHRGEVGIPNETTFVLDVKTYAMSASGQSTGVEHGIETWDTAQLTGYVPEGGTLEFEGYVVPVGDGAAVAEQCTTERLAWTSPAIELEGGLYPEGSPLELTGDRHVFNPDVDSALYWVAVVKDELGREVHRGACGDPDETIGLKGQKLIATGGELALGGLAAGLMVLSGLFFAIHRRRRHAA